MFDGKPAVYYSQSVNRNGLLSPLKTSISTECMKLFDTNISNKNAREEIVKNNKDHAINLIG